MRLTPAQGAVRLICGREVWRSGVETLEERLQRGRELLKEITGRDFGYDLAAWHAHLVESRDGGYTYGRNIDLPKIMKEALASAEWVEAAWEMQRREAR